MSKFFAIRNSKGQYVPAENCDWEASQKVPAGELVKCEYVKSRNYQFLRKFMAMVKLGHNNSDMDMPFDAYRHWAVMKAGFYKTYDTGKGTMFEPKSIAFDKMEAEEFEEVYSRVLDVICEDIGSTNQEVESELLSFM